MNTLEKVELTPQSAVFSDFQNQEDRFTILESWKSLDEGRKGNCKVLCFTSKRKNIFFPRFKITIFQLLHRKTKYPEELISFYI